MLDLMQRTPEDRHEQGCEERRRICRSFNMDTKADEWETLYRTVLE
jgi:hypothetical protein